MDKMAAFRQALAEIGDVPAELMSSFIEQKYKLIIEPRFVPFFRASLADLEQSTRFRQRRPPSSRGVRLSSGRQRFLDVCHLARRLLAQHGLHDWSFAYNRRKQTLGLCVYERRTIELSVYFVDGNSDAEVLDTILHEIAHALVGPRHGHDAVWKRKCVEIGARPERCGEANMPQGRWQACCHGCGQNFHRHRRPNRRQGWFCGDCGPRRGRLVWQHH
jgi:predicted SprT family Zn-dependent metalloprotease